MSIIIKKLVITPNKATLTYRERSNDPFEKTVSFDSRFEESQQSHVDALSNWIIEEAKAVYEEDKKQMTIFNEKGENPTTDDVGKEEEEEEDPTNFESNDEDSPEDAEEDFSQVAVPKCDETEIPNLRKMTKAHATWYINNKFDDADDLRQVVQFSMGERIHHRLGLDKAKEKAISLL